MKLTKPQQALLNRVRREGRVVVNGRSSKTVMLLAEVGLVEYEFEKVPGFPRGDITYRYTVTPKEQDD